MSAKQSGFVQILGDLDRKETRLRQIIADAQRDLTEIQITKKHVRALADESGTESLDAISESEQAEDAPKRALPYRGMSNPDAAVATLRAEGRPMKTADIGRAMKAGGLESEARDFNATVFGTLRRLAIAGQVVKVGSGLWTLPEKETESQPDFGWEDDT